MFSIQHFVISENLIDQCIDATPIHLAENLSNHEPIFLKLRIDPVKINGNTNKDQPISVSKPAWNIVIITSLGVCARNSSIAVLILPLIYIIYELGSKSFSTAARDVTLAPLSPS